MEVCSQIGFKCDEEKALSSLLDAFGSAFSLDEIASAYCKADRDANLAGEILSGMQRSPSTSTTNSPNVDAVVEACAESSDSFSSDNSFRERYLKPKVRPVSVGIVSSRLAKDYVRSMPSANRSYHGTTKPLKLDANLLTTSEVWAEKCEPNISNHNQLHQDMEDFLFKMLGDGFQLDREKIREVLGNCGYDMKKSMDKLMDGSILTFDKEARVVGKSSTRSTDRKLKSEVPSYERKSQNVDYLGTTNKGVNLHCQSNGIEKLQKELWTSLFQVREHSEESPEKIMKDVNKFTPYRRKVVSEPPEDSPEEFEVDINFSQQEDIDPEDEEKYQNLRKAVKEYRAAMIEYHRAAVDAFVNGEHDKAKKLLDEGQVYGTKAREADEESSKMIVDTEKEESRELVLDLHDYSAGEAIRLLKCHLSTLSGIPSFDHLKVIINASNENVTQSSRSQKRKRRITEMLEKQSINWIEGDTAGTILISLDKLDPKC
ncbi:hypothetical protein QN277_020225 [Acacia crassicarpa]|uniref:DUF1771 domain-containing protein n=1 Tax=Acacia crassicarpa TaxID=499986 RepID=A0AAE1JNL6_9FABA|nr:hypothetical protein QN277_020225 [Acacia crassicarpa]